MTTAIVPTPINPYAPSSFDEGLRLAKLIVASRLAPGLNSPEAAFLVLATGHELGLSPMQSIRGIHIIEGRPSPSADALVAIVLRSGICEYFREIETTDEASTWETKRQEGEPQRYTFTMEDARKAGLLARGDKSNWGKYPRRMLSARAKAYLARDVYPDLVLGLYTPDELRSSKQTPTPDNGVGAFFGTAPDIETEPEPEPEPPPVELLSRVTTAESLDALDAAGRAATEGGVDRELVVQAYKARREALRGAAAHSQ